MVVLAVLGIAALIAVGTWVEETSLGAPLEPLTLRLPPLGGRGVHRNRVI